MVGREERAVVHAPEDECGGEAVPGADDGEGDEIADRGDDVRPGAQARAEKRAAARDEDVVAHPL